METKHTNIVEISPAQLQTFRERGYDNAEILPKTRDQRTMTQSNYFTLWMGSIHNIPNYAAVVGYLALGLSPLNTMIALTLSGVAVALFLSINGQAGTKYGIPFAMHLRSTYGSIGAKLPGFLRGVVTAIAWFGVQTYVGAVALTILIGQVWPAYLQIGGGANVLGIGIPELISFIIFWIGNMAIGLGGGEILNKFTAVLSPLIMIVFGAMTIWAVKVGGGIGAILNYSMPGAESLNPIYAYILIISSTMAVWAGPGVSIADFTQSAVSESDQRKGQVSGLFIGYLVFAIMAVIIVIGGTIYYGEMPSSSNGVLDFINRWDSIPAIIVSTGVFLMTTISTNATGNILPAGYQLAALFPKQLDYKKGVWVAGIISVLIMPWKFMSGGTGILLFLDLIGALLGPVAGVMVAHYYIVQKQSIDLNKLYFGKENASTCSYAGVNIQAYIATIAGLLVSVSGNFIPQLAFLSRVAWVGGFVVAAIIHLVLTHFTDDKNVIGKEEL